MERRPPAGPGARGTGRARWARALGASLGVHAALGALLLAAGVAVRTAPPEPRVPLRVVGKAAAAATGATEGTLPAGAPAEAPGEAPGEATAAARARPDASRRTAPDPARAPPRDPEGTAGEAPATAPEAPGTGTPAAAATAADGVGTGSGAGTAGPGAGGPPGSGDGPGGGAAATAGAGTGAAGGGGTGAAGAGGDGDARLHYALGLRRRLEDASRYPGGARRAGRDGRVVLRVRVAPDGRVDSTAVEEASPWPDLDRAALAAAGSLQGLPPPPGGALDVLVPVVFRVR